MHVGLDQALDMRVASNGSYFERDEINFSQISVLKNLILKNRLRT